MSTASPAPLPELDTLLDLSDPVASEAAYRRLLPQARKLGADVELALLTRVARTLGLQGRYDEALALLDEVDAHAAGAGPEVAVRLLLEDGRVLNSSGQVDASAAFFEEAYARAQETGLVGLAVDAAHMLGIVLPTDPALEWNMDALRTAQASTDPAVQRWLGVLYNNTGWSLMERGDYHHALTLFQDGLSWHRSRDDVDATRIAIYGLAAALRQLGRIAEALPMLSELLTQWEAAGQADSFLVHEELAECLAAQGDIAAATRHYAAAARLLQSDPWFVKNEPERLARLTRLDGGTTGT